MSNRKLPQNSENVITLEPEEAIAIIGLFSGAVDGKITEEETESLADFLSEVGLFEDYSEEDFETLTENIVNLIEEEDPEDLISSAITSLPNTDYREAAFITALLVVSMDGEIPEEEEEYIAELQEALQISDETAQEIIDEIFGEYEDEEEEE